MSFLLLCPKTLLCMLSRRTELHKCNTGDSFKTFLWGLWWLLLGIIILCSPAHCSVFQIGLLGPWNCDPFFSKAFPHEAARLAVGRISKDPSLNLGQRLDFIILQEECETPRALTRFLKLGKISSAFIGPLNPRFCETATLLGENWNKPIFSWMCINYKLDSAIHHPTFARTLTSPTRVLFTIMKYFHWAHVGIISSNEDIWIDTAKTLASALRNQGLPVGIVTSMGKGEKDIEDTWQKIEKVGGIKGNDIICGHCVSVVLLCMHSVLIGGEEQAALLTKAQEMGLTDGRYVLIPYDTLLYSLTYQNNSFYTFDNNTKLQKAYDAVLTITLESGERTFYDAFREAKESGEIYGDLEATQVSPLFGTIYDAIYFMAMAIDSARRKGSWMSGTNIAMHTKNISFPGFSHWIETDDSGNQLSNYVILDSEGQGNQIFPTHLVDMSSDSVKSLGRSIHFPRRGPPKADSDCWFNPDVLCTGGKKVKKKKKKHSILNSQLFKGPNKILLTLDDLIFINPELNKKVSPPTLMKDLRHENVNPFLGFFSDCGLFAIVTEYCSRGSLEDLLRNEDMKLDWMFKSSLLMDLIKGIRYLHHRDFAHGRLKSRNCVVDGRFVLKITDYGYNELLETQKCPYVQPPPEELLWTAPELLRDPDMRRKGTFKGDIYSFAIILQEVVIRGPPYCTSDLTAEGRKLLAHLKSFTHDVQVRSTPGVK
uniref:guanylate cyclase n=1 Tax=Nothoprocta perdicaria TaxID=30464 RepID=A0A8C6ZIZ4_NOTPE